MNRGTSDRVMTRLMEDRACRDNLLAWYRYRQGLGGRPADRAAVARLAALGLASEKGAGCYLTRAGASLAYNLVELENQVARGAARPWLETLGVDGRSTVLDAGCGGGQTLLAAMEFRPRAVIGVDRDAHGIDFARFLFRYRAVPRESYRFLVSRLEDIGLPTACCNRVICRGVIHKTRVGPVLDRLAACLEPGGRMYLMAPGARYYFSRFPLTLRNPAWWLFFAFVFANGLWFNLTGRQLAPGVGRRRFCELFFTASSLNRALRRAGFDPARPDPGVERNGLYHEVYANRTPARPGAGRRRRP